MSTHSCCTPAKRDLGSCSTCDSGFLGRLPSKASLHKRGGDGNEKASAASQIASEDTACILSVTLRSRSQDRAIVSERSRSRASCEWQRDVSACLRDSQQGKENEAMLLTMAPA